MSCVRRPSTAFSAGKSVAVPCGMETSFRAVMGNILNLLFVSTLDAVLESRAILVPSAPHPGPLPEGEGARGTILGVK